MTAGFVLIAWLAFATFLAGVLALRALAAVLLGPDS